MSKPNNETNPDKNLENLYTKRKQRLTSPDELQQAIYQKLNTRSNQKQPWWKIELKQYMRASALAVCCALAFIVIHIQLTGLSDNQDIIVAQNTVNYNYITYHVLEDEINIDSNKATDQFVEQKQKRREQSNQRKIEYQQASSSYFAKQNTAYTHLQTYATVIQNESGLDLLTCEKELLKISQELVDIFFSDTEANEISFSQGRMVSVSFDNKGHIIELVAEEQRNHC